MTRRVTKRQAEAVLRLIRQQFKGWFDRPEDGPQLVMDFDYFGTGPNPAIVWEGGPYEWSFIGVHGGRGDFGETYPPIIDKLPNGVWTEAATSWALSLYREES